MRYSHPMFAGLLIASAVTLASALQVTPVAAQDSLRDMRAQQNEEQKLQREASFTGSVCGIRLSSSINWSKSRNWPANRSLADACDSALSALETVCRGELKSKVQKKVSSFQCSGDGSGPKLSGSTLSFGAGNGDGYNATRSYLERALN